MILEGEVWKPIPGYDGYEASTEGRIRSVDRWVEWTSRWGKHTRVFRSGRVLKGSFDGAKRYLHVSVLRDADDARVSADIHKLVAFTFIGPRPRGHVCRHKNGQSTDNRVVNLEYGYSSENADDSVRHGTKPQGDTHKCAVMSDETAARIRASDAESVADLARRLGTPYWATYAIKTGLSRRGMSRGGRSCLSVDEAKEVLASSAKTKDLAEKFGVTYSVVYAARTGRSWKHLHGTGKL